MSGLARTAITGVATNWVGSAALVGAQIASTAATARLVAPREFGAYATAQAAAGLAGYFTLNAIGNGLLRRSKLGSETIGTAVTLSLGSSALVAAFVWCVSSPWARMWNVPAAAGLVRVVAVTLFLSSAATVPMALIRRQLRFGPAAFVETASQMAGLAVGVALAFELHSALALAIGQSVGAGLLLAAAASLVAVDLRVRFNRGDARELLTFSGQVSVLSFSTYVANTAPGWFAARVFGASILGLYSRANLIVGLPLTYLVTSILKVLYPLYGRVHHDRARTSVLLDEGLTLTTGLLWPLFAIVAGASPLVVRILLGPRWHAAASLVALCALIGCAELACSLLTNAAEALGWMRVIARRQAIFLLGVGATLVTAHQIGLGLRPILLGISVSQWVTYVLTLTPFARGRLLKLSSVLTTQAIHAGAALAVYGIVTGCVRVVAGTPVVVQAAVVTGAASIAYMALLASRSWFPAGRVLWQRFTEAAPGAIGWRALWLGAWAR